MRAARFRIVVGLAALVALGAPGVAARAGAASASASAAVPAPVRISWLWDAAAQPDAAAREAAVPVRRILLSGSAVLVRSGARSAALGADVKVTPVVQVEVSRVYPPEHTEAGRGAVVKAMQQAALASTSGWVQLDMEVEPAQRAFYQSLVRELRATLPADIRLSVTVPGWWCRSPVWLDDLAADEVVPMFFNLGKDGALLRHAVETQGGTLHPRCQAGSAGFSSREPFSEAVMARFPRSYWVGDKPPAH